jgi:hypothetical protein
MTYGSNLAGAHFRAYKEPRRLIRCDMFPYPKRVELAGRRLYPSLPIELQESVKTVKGGAGFNLLRGGCIAGVPSQWK